MGEEELDQGDGLENLEDFEGSVDELPELAAWEKYRGPNMLNVEEEDNVQDYEGDEEDEETDNDEEEDDEEEEEDEEKEDELDPDMEEDDEKEEMDAEWLPELSAGEKYMGPSSTVEVPK